MNNHLKVSIIITTKNGEEHIKNCLEAVKKQNYPLDKIEIIVVDNNSSDRTIETAKEYTDKVFNYGPERSAQRNFGIEKACGKYILYLDVDMVLSKEVIKQCVEKCRNQDYIALYIPERIVNLSSFNQNYWIKVRDFERSFYNATIVDCVRFVRKDKCLEIAGFDESLTGPEDWDFDRKVRECGKTGIITASLYHNEGSFNLGRYLRKKIYYSGSFDAYINKWGKNDFLINRQLGVWYRYFGVFLENGKWKKLMRFPLLTLGMYGLRMMVGIGYLINSSRT